MHNFGGRHLQRMSSPAKEPERAAVKERERPGYSRDALGSVPRFSSGKPPVAPISRRGFSAAAVWTILDLRRISVTALVRVSQLPEY